uniref:Uncharacterized protein n=1 Tax=Arundo donax TaxID=35708 RepID=A0A0A9F5Z2_ARUDO
MTALFNLGGVCSRERKWEE